LAGKKVKNAKFYAIILVSVAFAALFSPYAFSLLTNSVVIGSSGQIAIRVYAASGSASDIQAAVNSISSSGGTVYVPAGTFHWNGEQVTIPGGVNVIGASLAGTDGYPNFNAYIASTILHNDKAPPNMPTMFVINGVNGKPTRISGIQFEATPPINYTAENSQVGQAIEAYMTKNLRVDHNTFINFANVAASISSSSGWDPTANATGVFDHNIVDNPYKLNTEPTVGYWRWGYGFYAVGNMKPDFSPPNWDSDITHFIGKFQIVPGATIMYVEDNHFSRTRHATDGASGAWGVIRYNLMDNAYPNWGDIDSHGSFGPYSARGFEVYSNTIIGPSQWSDNIAIRLRDGSGMIFNNTFTNSRSGSNVMVSLENDDSGNLYPFTHVNNTYIWGNTHVNSSLLSNTGGYIENANYFLRAPNQAQDGFIYTPYPYPHPLTTQP
jgi:hypothetical protein